MEEDGLEEETPSSARRVYWRIRTPLTSIIDKLLGSDKIALCYILYRAFSIILAERLKATSADLVNTKKELKKLKANKSK